MSKTHVVRIYNKSKQMIALQARAPGSEFYRNEQQVRIMPGKSVMLPKAHIMPDQITNLQARGMIAVTYDSESV